ncbi:MAG: putative quinol monooxygenase [Dongiaceae bacterium]
MMTITALLRARPGKEAALRDLLLEVAADVAANEPGTIGYVVSQSADDPRLLITHERFVDRAAMDRHNGSAMVAKAIARLPELLAEPIALYTANELSGLAR